MFSSGCGRCCTALAARGRGLRGSAVARFPTLAVVNVFLSNRPGLVADISYAVHEYGGNVEETRMHRVGDYCTVTLMTAFEAEGDDANAAFSCLRAALRRELLARGARDDLHIAIEPTNPFAFTPSSIALVTVSGNDEPGIVKEVTAALAHSQIDIVLAETEVKPLPYSGEKIFQLKLTVAAPDGVTMVLSKQVLESQLEKVSRKFTNLNVDVEVPDLFE